MARTATKSSATTSTAVVTENAATADFEKDKAVVEDNMNTRANREEKLLDTEEIAIESLVPNVSYKDSKTGDDYDWDEVGHIEYLTVETLKNMWRSYKGYFRNMWLRPLDDRVIKQFGMGKFFSEYDCLLNADYYTRENLPTILTQIAKSPTPLKTSIINRIHSFVKDGELTDVKVLRDIEKRFDLDLISLL